MIGSAFSQRLLPAAAAALLIAALGTAHAAAPSPAPRGAATAETVNRGLVALVTGHIDSTAARLATDLADIIDDGATRRLLPVLGKGAQQGVTDLRLLRGIDLAILQADAASERERGAISYIMMIGSAELHLVAGPDVHALADLAGKKVNVEPSGSGTAVTVANLFRALKLPIEVTAYDNAAALAKLGAGEIAAVAVVGGKPVPAIATANLPAGAHLVPVPLSGELGKSYTRATITAEDYPKLLQPAQSIETIATPIVLAAANLPPDSERYRNVAGLVDALFTQFDKLRGPAYHPKWRDADIRAELPGWRRFPSADAWLKRNPAPTTPVAGDDLKEVFVRFLDERGKAGGVTLSQQRKDELFAQFQRWRQQQRQQAGR